MSTLPAVPQQGNPDPEKQNEVTFKDDHIEIVEKGVERFSGDPAAGVYKCRQCGNREQNLASAQHHWIAVHSRPEVRRCLCGLCGVAASIHRKCKTCYEDIDLCARCYAILLRRNDGRGPRNLDYCSQECDLHLMTRNADGSIESKTLCCVCHDVVDEAKAIDDGEETSDKAILAAEVICHEDHYYHAPCYWPEVRKEMLRKLGSDARLLFEAGYFDKDGKPIEGKRIRDAVQAILRRRKQN